MTNNFPPYARAWQELSLNRLTLRCAEFYRSSRNTAVDMQQSTRSSRHTAVDIQQSTHSSRHTAVDAQQSTRNRRHAAVDIQQSTHNSRHAAVNTQQPTRSSQHAPADTIFKICFPDTQCRSFVVPIRYIASRCVYERLCLSLL